MGSMTSSVSRFARISGVGMYLPEKRITNAELAEIMDYDVDGYLGPKGITVRYQAAPDESTSDMATRAARQALDRAHLQPDQLDLIILATDTPDYVSPPTSAVVQHKLGAVRAGCFDVNAACADETIALALASHFIMLDPAMNHVLVIGAYGMTKWLDWCHYSESSSKVLATLFGDGAGAVILSSATEPGYLSSRIIGRGEYWDTYGIYLGTAEPVDLAMVQEKRHYLRFHDNQHRVPSDFNASLWPRLIRDAVEKAGHTIDQLSMVLVNQVELDAAQETLKVLGLPPEKTHWVADRFGYTGSASALMALYDAIEQGKIKSGDLLAFCTSGAGFVVASALFRWA